MEKIKTILHIIDTTGPGGAETVFIELLTHMPASRYRPVVVIRGKGWVYEELCRRGFEPLILDAKGSFNWRYLLKLVRLIRQRRVDLIQSHLLGSNVYSALAGLLTGVPVVATFHGMVDVGQSERFSALKFAAINAGSRAIVAVSEDLKNNIVQRTRLRADKTGVIYNGIDTAAFGRDADQAYRQRFGWPEDTILVGCLGNIRPAKAYDILLEAAASVIASDNRYRFLIAGQGSGSLYRSLLAQRSRLALDGHVEFLGFNDDPAAFLANLDVFVLSSRSEGFSIATIQAMATGLPVVATRSGGPQEILTGPLAGLLVEAENPAALAAGIMAFSERPEWARDMARAGRDHARTHFDIKAMIAAYEALYRRVMD